MRRAALALTAASIAAIGSTRSRWPNGPTSRCASSSPMRPAAPTTCSAGCSPTSSARPSASQFFVENRTGGGGMIATEAVARAAPDGYTLQISGMPSHVLAPVMTKNTSVDPIKDFTHIAYLGGPPNVFVVHPSLGVNSFQELLALMKREKDGMQYVSPNVGAVGNMVAEYVADKGEGQARARRLSRRRRRDPGPRRRPRQGRQHDAVDHAAAYPCREAQSAGGVQREAAAGVSRPSDADRAWLSRACGHDVVFALRPRRTAARHRDQAQRRGEQGDDAAGGAEASRDRDGADQGDDAGANSPLICRVR